MGSYNSILGIGSALLVAWALASGCGDSVTGGEAGSGGTAATCPLDRPTDGASCSAELVCTYQVTPENCATAQPCEARCVGGQWQVAPAPASCGPLTSPSCDPLGDWTLSFAWLDGCASGPSTLSITQSPEGIVYVDASTAGLSADGCTLVASWLDIDSGDWGFIDQELQLTLDFAAQPVAGTASYQCVGECACDDDTATVTAVQAVR